MGKNKAQKKAEQALCDAAYRGDLATLKRLVEEGVNLEARDDERGWTALMIATDRGKLDCLEYLIAKGAKLDATGKFGDTALMMAAREGKLDCLELLIANGAKLDATNIAKNTALHWAAANGHAPCVEALLKAGADARLKNEDGETALDDAKDEGHTQVIALLRNAAAVAARVSRNAPDWAKASSNEMNLEEKHKELKVAAGALADAAVQAVKAYLGDFTGLLGLVDTLKNQVITMSWSSKESSERKAAVEYDRAKGQFALVLIERQSSAKDVKVPVVGAKTYTLKLNVKVKRMDPSNDAARQICQDLMNQQVGDLAKQIGEMKLFG